MKELSNLIASRFIARTDCYAVQRSDGSYNPVNEPITRSVVENHLHGNATYGHYLIGPNNQAKFFCFDIDLQTEGIYWIEPDLTLMPNDCSNPADWDAWYEKNKQGPFSINPRQAWKNRDPQSRPYFKERFRYLGEILTKTIHDMGVPTCMTYSGHKGIHVYGFTGRADAAMIRLLAHEVLDQVDIFQPGRGSNFFVDKTGEFPGLELELFPKQDKVEEGHYGNLLRMEFGVNLKSPKDPCFLVNQTLAHTQLAPHPNPAQVLETGNPWQTPIEKAN